LNRYVKTMGCEIDGERIRQWLLRVREEAGSPKTYAWCLCGIKALAKFLNKEEWVKTLRFPKIKPSIIIDLPDKRQLQAFFNALPNVKAKAIFLLYASSGLRRSEIFNAKIRPELRMIIPQNHETFNTKNSYISFYNHETEAYLKQINFNVKCGQKSLDRWFNQAYQKTGIKVTAQILREWFCSEMGKLGVPDRYVDAFCGRIPKTVLAKRYTEYGPEILKQIYDKANLSVLS
jgi:integrase